MEEYDNFLSLVQGGELDAAKVAFDKHFGLKRESYAKFDDLAKNLGFEKANGVSTLDHYTNTFQSLSASKAELEKANSAFAEKLKAFEGKTTEFDTIKAGFDAQILELNNKLAAKDSDFVKMSVLRSINPVKFSEAYEGIENDIKKLAANEILTNYDWKIEDGEMVAYKDGNKALKDGAPITVEGLVKERFAAYVAQQKNVDGDGKHSKTPPANSASDAAIAAGYEPGTKAFYDFIRAYNKK